MKILTKLILTLILCVLAMPVFLVVRSFLPMDRPEFEDRTIWALMADRHERFFARAANYPDAKPEACTISESVGLVMVTGWATFCGAADVNPDLRKFVHPRDAALHGCGAIDASPLQIFDVTWQAFEAGAYELLRTDALVPACRLGGL